MKSVTSNKVLPDWAVIELGQVAEEYGLEITVKQARSDWAQLRIAVNSNKRVIHFLVSMRDDWEDLLVLGGGDLWNIVEQKHLESFHA